MTQTRKAVPRPRCRVSAILWSPLVLPPSPPLALVWSGLAGEWGGNGGNLQPARWEVLAGVQVPQRQTCRQAGGPEKTLQRFRKEVHLLLCCSVLAWIFN